MNYKNIKISNVINEMLLVLTKKYKGTLKPEQMTEKLIENAYRELK